MAELVTDAIMETYSSLDEDERRADIGLAEFIGSVASGTPTDASKIEEAFGEGLARRHSEGRL